MDSDAIKKFIAEKVPQGYSLSKIQDMLKEQNVNITFMELRLLASEIESGVWAATEAKAEAARKKDAPAPSAALPDAEAEDAFPPDAEIVKARCARSHFTSEDTFPRCVR